MIKHSVPLILMLLVLACSGHKGNTTLVDLSAEPVTITPGTDSAIGVRVRVSGDYHFNKDFPSSLTISNADGLAFKQKVWDSSAFRKKGNGALVMIPFTAPGNACQDHTVEATVDCSVCKADECRIFKGLKINVPVKCKKK